MLLTLSYKNTLSNFFVEFLGILLDDENLMSAVVFSNDATSRLSDKVNKPNCRIWAPNNASSTVGLERVSPEAFYTLSEREVPGPMFLLIQLYRC
jgi:hypothetical protein